MINELWSIYLFIYYFVIYTTSIESVWYFFQLKLSFLKIKSRKLFAENKSSFSSKKVIKIESTIEAKDHLIQKRLRERKEDNR